MMQDASIHDVVGVMSGTSLDGLDIALCRFFHCEESYNYNIEHAATIPYDESWKKKLGTAHLLGVRELILLHNEFGTYIGKEIKKILQTHQFHPECIASHGHTVLHEPLQGLTLQIGSGAHIMAETGIDTVCDFRTLDISLGGQGAPLVPFGDIHLFEAYDAALNIGGFSNITIMKPEMDPVAFDICPVNFVLNTLAKRKGVDFDNGGQLASSGNLLHKLLEKFEKIELYHSLTRVSLGREWVEDNIIPLLDSEIDATNLLRTYTEHAVLRIADVLNSYQLKNCLITGGGAYNLFLISRLHDLCETRLVIPDDLTVQFKEALIFAFLGLKRMNHDINVLSSVTRSQKDTVSGTLWKSK